MEIKEVMTKSKKETKTQEEKELDIKRKLNILKEFLISTKDDDLNTKNIDKLKSFFEKMSSILSAGFDYYYLDDFGILFNMEDLPKEIDSAYDILINEKHLDKLEKVVNCFDDIEYLNFGEHSIIWYKESNLSINLIPFERDNNNNLIIKRVERDTALIRNDDVLKIENNSRKEYNGLGYKVFK